MVRHTRVSMIIQLCGPKTDYPNLIHTRERKRICSPAGVIERSAKRLMKPVSSLSLKPSSGDKLIPEGQHTETPLQSLDILTTFLLFSSNVITLPKPYRMLFRTIRATDLACSLWHVTDSVCEPWIHLCRAHV